MNISISKHIKKPVLHGILSVIALGGASAGLLSSCSDFLDITPLNKVVLENFWTQKSEVNAVLMGCYESLESEESIIRMGVWGEMRSENILQGASIGNEYNEILNENILPTNSLTKWNVMYQTINRCNTVCHYAPMVQKKDPNYTVNELNANIAEASFIRDLCYFYLIRTFRDVPLSFEPTIDDTKEFQIPATPMNAALDSLIKDLESVKDYAVKRYVDDSKMSNAQAASQAYENSSRVTRVAIYALLADLNLWRGNYDETIKYCDLIIDFKKNQYKEKIARIGDLTDMQEFAGIPLILEAPAGSVTCGNAYNEIFGTGNSFESIFELYFRNNQQVKNKYVNEFFGKDRLGSISGLSRYCKDAATGNSDLFTKNDCRVYATSEKSNSRYAITKYVNSSVSMDIKNVTDEKSLKLTTSRGNAEYANWIIYRLTDVMLMKAEACILKGEAEYETAFTLINAVNKRAHNYTTSAAKDTLVFDDYRTSQEKMEQLLLDERNRELMFEGKRWYDLVRIAVRDGNNQRLVSEATKKYQDKVNALKIKLADPNIIFFPYNKEELKVNPFLKQNSAYGNTEEFEQ
ncbi:MAG: RagB/SusD family nutrient uptake outer membrane protein [Prevotella sp.]|nr:RagB/SusD family nutrient uptake outer membrane protein [Prevotella sp.]MCI6403767.1 RagB/SusD family nutrient uptake outer membrane protein [Prevotella sp.]MCI6806020.1 RagB/SusD family nutrient uptake outer membrane protein [Prevotella sp.]MDD6993463.1 RagB/SusD family nutrient uptake outer membrane protein [Prevotella sp.]MDY3073883.1 RagB/SusD family nutrient uptake outer membrane protein [Prevotella sp.]